MDHSTPSYPEFQPSNALNSALDGDRGEAMVTWRRKPGGEICITEMEGVPLGDGDDDEGQEDSYDDEGGETPMSRAQDGLTNLANATPTIGGAV